MGPTTRPGATPRVVSSSVHSRTLAPVPSPPKRRSSTLARRSSAPLRRRSCSATPPLTQLFSFDPTDPRQHLAFDPAAHRHFAVEPAAPLQHFAVHPVAAMGRGSAGYNYNLNLPATRPEHQRFGSGSGSGSGPPSSPGLGPEGPPAHLADSTIKQARVDNLRLPFRRPAYVPPSSLSLGPHSQSTSSASRASMPKLSYSALAKHGSATGMEMDKWKTKLLNYLKRYVHQHLLLHLVSTTRKV